MLYELALEPSVLYEAASTRRNFKDFVKGLSFGSPLVFSEFPKLKKLRKEVLSNQPAELDEQSKARLTELLQFIANEAPKVRRDVKYDGNLSWRANALVENNRIEFDHVLTCEADSDLSSCTLSKLFDGALDHPSQVPVQRVADEMTSVISNVLRLATHVVFVDPYFGPGNRKWQPFLLFLDAALSNKPDAGLFVEFLYNYDADRAVAPSLLLKKLRSARPDMFQRCEVQFRGIREKAYSEKLHNRYVLTDIGGLSFGVGLDEEDENHLDDVSLLNHDLYQLRWKQYVNGEAFETVDIASSAR